MNYSLVGCSPLIGVVDDVEFQLNLVADALYYQHLIFAHFHPLSVTKGEVQGQL